MDRAIWITCSVIAVISLITGIARNRNFKIIRLNIRINIKYRKENLKYFGKDQYWHSIFVFAMKGTDRPFGFEYLTRRNVFTLYKLNFSIFYLQWMAQTCFIVYTTFQVWFIPYDGSIGSCYVKYTDTGNSVKI